MMIEKTKVRVKAGCTHRLVASNYDPDNPDGKPGPLAVGGDIIEVTEQELRDFGDKFEQHEGVEPRRGRPKKIETDA